MVALCVTSNDNRLDKKMNYLEHIRGNPFRYSFTLGNGWTGSAFTGGYKIVMRHRGASLPTDQVDDDDAYHISSVANGEITFSGSTGSVYIASEITNAWEPGNYIIASQGLVLGTPDEIYEMEPDLLIVKSDFARGKP